MENERGQGHHRCVKQLLGDLLARFVLQLNWTLFPMEGEQELQLHKCCAMRHEAAQLTAAKRDLDSDLTGLQAVTEGIRSRSGLIAMNNMMSLHPDLIVLILHGKYHMEVAD